MTFSLVLAWCWVSVLAQLPASQQQPPSEQLQQLGRAAVSTEFREQCHFFQNQSSWLYGSFI